MASKYKLQYELGSGAFGKAVVVKHKDSNKDFVAKVIQVKNLSEVELDRCVTEVLVLGSCKHRNIIQYVEAFVDKGSLHIVMQFAKGGDLHNKIEIQNTKGVFFSNEVILDWFVQTVQALDYIHSKGILHRDLKPQNVFLTHHGTVKLGDFGIAKILSHGDDLASTRIGTPFYISPEICAGKQYNSSSDMWAAGCLLFELALLRVPFNAASLSALTKNIIQCQFDKIPRCFSPTIPALITQLIVFEPEQRLTASQILQLPELSDLVIYHTKCNLESVKVSSSRSNKKSVANDDKTLGRTEEKAPVASGRKLSEVDSGKKMKVNEDNEYVNIDVTKRCLARKDQDQSHEIPSQREMKTSHVSGQFEKRPRSYSLKESVIRKLSAASPKLAETVRQQRLSISETKQCDQIQVETCHDAMDDVFSPDMSKYGDRHRNNRGSLTYTVIKPSSFKKGSLVQTQDENNNTAENGDINSVLVLALSVSRSNHDLAKSILKDNLAYGVGMDRSEELLSTVKQLVLEEGQTYSALQNVLQEKETQFIPVIALMLTL